MRLICVELEDIKSYAGTTPVALEEGVNALVGHNGAGKSTILEAIGLALFNYLPYKQEEFVRRGAQSGRVMVTLLSELDDRRYQVERTVGKRAGWFVFDPELGARVAEGTVEVSAWLCEHFELEPRTDLRALFQDSVGPSQGTFTAPFLDNTTDRKAKFDRLLRVDEYEKAWQALKDVRAELERRRAEAEAAAHELARRTADLPLRLAARDLAAAEVERLASLGETLALDRERAAHDLERRDAAQARLQAAQARQERDQADLTAAEQRLVAATALLAESEEAARVVAASRAGHDAHRAALDLAEQQEQRRRTRDALALEHRGAEDAAREREAARGRQAQALAEAEADAARLAALAPRISEQDAARQAFDAAQRALADLEAEQRTLDGLRLDLVQAEAEQEEANRLLRELRQDKQRAEHLAPLQTEFDALQARLADLQQRAEELARVTAARDAAERAVSEAAREEAAVSAELAALAALRPAAELLPARQEEERELGGQHHAAQLAVAEMQATRRQVEGGLCPFFKEACLNVAEKPGGLTLEGYFDQQLVIARQSLAGIEIRLGQARTAREQATEAHLRLQDEPGILTRLGLLARERARLEAERDHHLAAERELADAPQRVQEARGRLDEIRAALVALRDAAERAGGYQAAERALVSVSRRASQARAKLQRVEQALERLPVARAELAAHEARLREIGDARGEATALRRRAEQVQPLRATVEQLEREHRALAARVAALAAELEPYADVDRLLAEAQDERNATRADYERHLAHRAAAGLLDERRAAASTEQAQRDQQAQRTAEATQAYVAATDAYDAQAHRAAREMHMQVERDLASTATALENARADLERLGRDLADLERLEAERQRREADKAELADAEALADRMRGVVRQTGPRIAQTLRDQASRMATTFFADIIGDATGHLEWTDEYDVTLHQRGQQRVFKQLSGGEQMAAALSVRLALLRLFSKLRIAFLDEPTTNMDEARRTNLAQQLGELRGFDQMLVISHDDAFDGLYGHVCHIEKVDGASRVAVEA